MCPMCSENSELVYDVVCVLEQFNQPFGDTLSSPPTKILERYTELRSAIALEITCNIGSVQFGMCPLITFHDSPHLPRHSDSRSWGVVEDKFSMLIDNVEVVDYPKGGVVRIGGLMRLKLFDESPSPRIRNSLYFSFIKLTARFLGGQRVENGKLDLPNVVYIPYGCDREMPNDMVKTGSQLMIDLADQHAESWWDGKILEVLNCIRE